MTSSSNSVLARRLARLETHAKARVNRYAAYLLEADPALEERFRRRIESITDPEEAGRVGLIMIGMMAATSGEADTLRRLQLSGQSEDRARALLAAAQEERRQNPQVPAARSPWDRFDPEGKPYAATATAPHQWRRY